MLEIECECLTEATATPQVPRGLTAKEMITRSRSAPANQQVMRTLVAAAFLVAVFSSSYFHVLFTAGTSWHQELLINLPMQTSNTTIFSHNSVASIHDTTKPPFPRQDALNSTAPFAYAFVIGGCDPNNSPSYQNYLFNILVAARILRERGSKADVVALFQVSSKATQKHLPDKDLRLLHALGVHVYYIPQQKEGVESFYRTQIDKFRILGLTQYQRVLFMDGDVMPLANFDFLFECSLNGTLQENVVVQGIFEPANGGFFMLRPGYLEQINSIVQWRERTAKSLPYPHFDEVVGWGQPFPPDDPWRSIKGKGTNYTFLAAFADQGLLYYYTKYVRQSVSILMRNGDVESWEPGENDSMNTTQRTTPTRVATSLGKQNFEQAVADRIKLPGKHNRFGWPIRSFNHFSGPYKPWMKGPPPKEERTSEMQFKTTIHYWFWKLHELNVELGIGLDFDTHWLLSGKQKPPLGLWPVQKLVPVASSDLLPPLERVFPAAAS